VRGVRQLPELYALNWQAVFVPKGTPQGVVTKLNSSSERKKARQVPTKSTPQKT
jgi:hypothetical protein